MWMGVLMLMLVLTLGEPRDQLEPALLHAAHREDPIRDRLELIRLALHDDHLEAERVTEVDVQRGAHALAELVLQIREALAEIPHVVVVHDRQRAHGAHALGRLRPPHRRARQVAEQLRPRAAALPHDGVELAQQRALERDAEPDERVFHLLEATTAQAGVPSRMRLIVPKRPSGSYGFRRNSISKSRVRAARLSPGA